MEAYATVQVDSSDFAKRLARLNSEAIARFFADFADEFYKRPKKYHESNLAYNLRLRLYGSALDFFINVADEIKEQSKL